MRAAGPRRRRRTEPLLGGQHPVLLAGGVEEAHLHRLWYDFRSQAMYEASFREDAVQIDASLERMIWRVVSRFAELTGQDPQISSAAMYAIFDGLFLQALIRQVAGDPAAAGDLRTSITAVMRQVLPAEQPART